MAWVTLEIATFPNLLSKLPLCQSKDKLLSLRKASAKPSVSMVSNSRSICGSLKVFVKPAHPVALLKFRSQFFLTLALVVSQSSGR